MSKLDDLCAIKVMGWKLSNGIEMYSDGQWYTGSEESPDTQRQGLEWNPSTSLDDALVCLERAAGGLEWYLSHSCYADDLGESMRYECSIENYAAEGSTVPLAICLCSLRAMGVPESEISIAMEN